MKTRDDGSRKYLILDLPNDDNMHACYILLDYLTKEAKRVGDEIKAYEAARGILAGLEDSWRSRDPGKYGHAYFFLKNGKRVVLRELLAEDTRIFTDQKEWDNHSQQEKLSHVISAVPPFYSVVTLDEVDKRVCPKCSILHPVIEHYVQSYDSDSYDEWVKEQILICGIYVVVLTSESRSHRF